MLYTDMKTRLPDHLLAISDRMSMAHSLETRPVLVDKEFVEFSARVPCKYKLRGTRLKYLLRRVAERYLPRELIYRKKQGFSFPIGKWLDLAEDDTGLYCHGELTPGHSVASNVYASMRHEAISGLSIGFRVPIGGAEEIEGGGRRISKVNLIEISVVGFPADNDARIQIVKSEIEQIQSIRDCEVLLRDAGFSRSMAKALLGQLRPLYLREADEERQHKQAQDAAREWLRELIVKQRK